MFQQKIIGIPSAFRSPFRCISLLLLGKLITHTALSLIQALISIKLSELYLLQAENNNETQVTSICTFK